jgi:hypothetical protein
MLEMQYPHWLMVAGAAFVVLGFIGFAFRRNRTGPVKKPSRAREKTPGK